TIGSQTGMGIGTLNPILKRMAENEWIEKSQHPTDKRTMLISLSAKAKESKQPINQAILAEMISCNFEGMDLPELMLQLANLQQRLDTINENK
ncbi:MarR family transcriptional regulator, partial [Jeotgalibaca porci]